MRAIGKEIYSQVMNYHELDESDTTKEKRLRRVLSPISGLRTIKPRCCFTCAYLKPLDAAAQCLRPGGPTFDIGDGFHHYTICNGYRQED